MAYNAIADITSLNAGLTSIANAIRSKGGTTASLAFPSAFINAVNALKDPSSYIDGTITSAQNASLSSIPAYAFYYCSSLVTISFPACVTIGDNAFTRCTSLVIASFPKCTKIGSNAFGDCWNLTTAYFPLVTEIGTLGLGSPIFDYCIRLTTISFPACTLIGSMAFRSCSALATASFPKCSIIGYSAFQNCYKLISLYLMNPSVVSLDAGAFSSTPIGGYSTSAGKLGSVFVPASLLAAYKTANFWSNISNRIVGI